MSEARAALRWDGAIVASALALTALGVVMNYSTTAALAIGEALPPLALRHVAGVMVALVCAAVAARMPLRFWENGALWMWAVSVVLLGLTLVTGLEAKGAQRWLAVPGLPVAIQPSELARLFTVLAVAALLARAKPASLASRRLLLRVVLLVATPIALLLFQPDFGSAVILCAIVGVMLFAAGMPVRLLAAPALAAGIGAAAYVTLRPYAWARVRGFMDPWASANDTGFQLVQSYVAFGRGGTFGVGLGSGRQKLFYLPEAHTDFILSVIAEEVGLLGVLVVLGAFAALCWAGLRAAGRAREPFALLVATGCTAMVVIPALCNAAVVMGLLPTTGLALPLLSHGSNSLVCTALALGMLLRVAGGEDAGTQPRRRSGVRRS